MHTFTRSYENSDSKKLYSFEDQDFRLTENQESINFGLIKEDNTLNVPSPIQNNTMQEMDSEFLKEYEDAISDRDKKIAELMHEIEKLKLEKKGNSLQSNEIAIKEARQKIKTNFDLLTKLIKEIEKILLLKNSSVESPKFNAGEKNYERNEIVNVLIEALGSFEQEFTAFFDNLQTKDHMNLNEMEPNFAKKDNGEKEELESQVDNIKKENIEMKYELQNSIQQIQELEIENIGLNDQISTLKKQMDNLKAMQDNISEKEEILTEKNEKLENELKDKEEAHLVAIGSLKEKYNVLLEKKQNEIADLNKSRQTLLQFEMKIQDLLKEINNKTAIIGQLNLKNQQINGKIQSIKRNVYRFYFEKTANLKIELNYMKKNFQEFKFQTLDSLKHNFSMLVLKCLEEKKKTKLELEGSFNEQINDYERKLKKNKATIKGLKKELNIANEFKYQSPPEETLNLMQSKMISEIEERKSFYPKDFMKDTNFFKKAFILQDKGTQTEETEKPSFYLNESLNKFEEQNLYVNKEIALINNNMTSLEQDYKTFLNLYAQTLKESSSKNVLKESRMLSCIEKIYLKIEETTKKDEKIHNIITKLNDRTFRLDEEKFSRLNRTEFEKENSYTEIQKYEQENVFLVKELEKLRKKLAIKENELKDKNENINRLEKEKKQSMNENKDLQVALHLKNTQFQMVVNKTNNYSLHMKTENTPRINREIFSKKMSLFPAMQFEEKDMIHTPKNVVSNKETLNSIKRIFQNNKI